MKKLSDWVKICSLVFSFMIVSHVHAGITLNMLTWEGYSPDAQVAEFKAYIKEKYGEELTFNITYISSADEYFSEIRRKSVDIIAPSHNIIKDERYKLISKGLLLPINLDNIPNYSKILPSLQKADYATVNGLVYTVPLVHGPYGLAYNTALVDSEPKSWSVFWDSKYQGRYTLSSDYSEVNIYITALALGLGAENIASTEKLSDPSVKKKLAELIANANNLWQGVDTADDLEKNTLAAAWGFSFPELAKRGQVWRMAEPTEGTTGWVDGHALTMTLEDKPQLKKIAEEWINFTLSDQFQIDVIVRGIGSAPVNVSIKDKLTSEEVLLFHLNEPDYFKNNRILWPTLTSRQRNFFKVLWKEAFEASKR